MSLRPGRALLGLLVGMTTLVAVPASALASGETLTVTPANTQAGGLTSVTAALDFAAGDTPATVVTSLAPGMLGNLNANPSCLASQQLASSCQSGTATVGTNAGALPPGSLYLVPPHGGDAAGIDFVPGAGSPAALVTQYIGVALNPNAPGGLDLTTTFPNPSPAQISSFSVSFTTLGGQPFTRLPSSCNPATSSFSVAYYGGTPVSQASYAFTPSGCQNLPYAPTLSGTVTKDAKDSGATVAFGVAQAAGESASRSITLKLPNALGVNALAVAGCLTGSGCTVRKRHRHLAVAAERRARQRDGHPRRLASGPDALDRLPRTVRHCPHRQGESEQQVGHVRDHPRRASHQPRADHHRPGREQGVHRPTARRPT